MAYADIRLTLLDVGQGLSAVIETAEHVLLFDTGPRFIPRFNAGSAVIIPHLQQNNINRLNLLIQSHGDNDNIGGLASILEEIQVDRISSSVPQLIDRDSVDFCQHGQNWSWDGARFEILHPDSNSTFSGNDRSCVLKISNGKDSILLTGDIEIKAERMILDRDRNKLTASVLLVPHHGSLTSSTKDFIAAVKPEYVLFVVGHRNRFGFPKKDIIRRYQEADAHIMDTASSGAIEIYLSSGGIRVRSHRQYGQRFWNGR